MKRIVGALLMIFVAVSPPALSIAEEEIYWGQAPPTSSDITDDDFSINFDKPQTLRTFGDQEIYDTYKAKDLLPETQSGPETGPSSQSTVPIQPEPVVRTAPPIRTNISSPLSTQRSAPAASTPARITPAPPKPAETAPGATQPASTPDASVNSGGSSPPSQDDQDRPATKKMKWGQTESKSGESTNKFQWGKQGQEN